MRRRASVLAALLENDELLHLSRLVRRALHDKAKLHKSGDERHDHSGEHRDYRSQVTSIKVELD
jgi:hypothetical protein